MLQPPTLTCPCPCTQRRCSRYTHTHARTHARTHTQNTHTHTQTGQQRQPHTVDSITQRTLFLFLSGNFRWPRSYIDRDHPSQRPAANKTAQFTHM